MKPEFHYQEDFHLDGFDQDCIDYAIEDAKQQLMKGMPRDKINFEIELKVISEK